MARPGVFGNFQVQDQVIWIFKPYRFSQENPGIINNDISITSAEVTNPAFLPTRTEGQYVEKISG
jgi:hypothetical protein